MTPAPLVLPHQTRRLFLTDGGIQTWLMSKKGYEVPHFCAFNLLNDPGTRQAIRLYYRMHAELAHREGVGFIFDSLTYRSSSDWGTLLGYSRTGLAEMNWKAFELYRDVASEVGLDPARTLYSGCVGPRDDADDGRGPLTEESAQEYHAEQIDTVVRAGAQLITGLTLSCVAEAIGIARAARAAGVPSVISFTLDRGARVRGCVSLKQAIETVDGATDGAPAYYMVNCSHPLDFSAALEHEPWMQRVRGLRANASSIDRSGQCQLGCLDEGDPDALALAHRRISRDFPHLNVFGGCCGTDYVHLEKILQAVRPGGPP